ncbi:MAG: YHS domain-containing (seleno)protein [Verrucomicrobiota bacterium]
MKTLLWSFLFLFAGLALRAEKPVNATWLGVAIDGYDPVAYFVAGVPAKGDKTHRFDWNGATWRFASAANLEAFKADPEKYAPQFGGYCAWAVAQGHTAGIDPRAWKIVEGKLYLNYSLDVQKKWENDIPAHIKAARANWPKIIAD